MLKSWMFAATTAVLAASSLAHADPRVAALDPTSGPPGASPELTATTAPAVAPPSLYLAAGASFGAEDAADWVAGGAAITAGYRLTDTLWVRGRVDTEARMGYGAVNQSITLVSPERAHVDVLVGLETRRCASPGLCLVAGSDGGYRSADSKYGAGVEFVPRIGLDVGGDHLRFRPALETTIAWIGDFDHEVGILPSLGIGASAAIAYQW